MKNPQVIIDWLKDQVTKSGQTGFVLGVSGGVDSGLVSTLCAMTGLKTIVVTMPIHQAQAEVTRADKHIKWLESKFENVESVCVNLTDTFETLRKALPMDESIDDLAMANTRSRLRMTTLYTFAGHHKLLVAGTGNKVEDLGIGFFTKYGDGGVDISPIGDLLKSEVREMARQLGVIPEISEAVPTDGLWSNGATDEDQIGATYDELEWAMSPVKPARTLTEREQQVMDIYNSRHNKNKHKMEPIPVCTFD